MLTASQKAAILESAGVAVPEFPARRVPSTQSPPHEPRISTAEEYEGDAEYARAVTRWKQEVEALHVSYAAARAARSLREAEDAKQMDLLRRANARPPITERGGRENDH